MRFSRDIFNIQAPPEPGGSRTTLSTWKFWNGAKVSAYITPPEN